jgi:hypothetical protein
LRSGQPQRSSPRTPRAVLGVATLTAPARGGSRRGLRAQAASSPGDSRPPPNGPARPLSHRGRSRPTQPQRLDGAASSPWAQPAPRRTPARCSGLPSMAASASPRRRMRDPRHERGLSARLTVWPEAGLHGPHAAGRWRPPPGSSWMVDWGLGFQTLTSNLYITPPIWAELQA